MRRRYLLALLVLVATACSDDIATVPAQGNPAPGDAVIFDRVKHIVLEPVPSDQFETITVLAHLCGVKAQGCPDGTEEIIPMSVHQIIPTQRYLSNPEAYLDPPDACLAQGTTCYLSIAHCEFDSRADQAAAGPCVPDGPIVGVAAQNWRGTGTAECLSQRATHSHHIDHGCLRRGLTS